MALYPYTLQPIAVNMTELEFKSAQLALFEQSNQSFSLKNIKPKEWVIMAIVAALAIAGLVFVSGYSTILFWLMLAGVVGYLLVRTIGFKWYVKKEFEKQMASTEMPEEMQSLKLGVQKHGLIMSMPVNPSTQHTQNKKGKGKRGMQMQSRMPQMQQGVIPWEAVTSWDETDAFLFILFSMQGQTGSQIIPKRLANNKFPINTVQQHLQEVIPNKGIQAHSLS